MRLTVSLPQAQVPLSSSVEMLLNPTIFVRMKFAGWPASVLAWGSWGKATIMSCFAFRPLTRVLILVFCVGMQPVLAQRTKAPTKAGVQAPKQKPTETSVVSANSEFDFIKGMLSFEPLKDKAAWEGYLRTAGLVPWRDATWHLEAADGEVRAECFFLEQETSCHLFFLPSGATPLSDATLSWLYRTASGFSFQEGDKVELQFPEEALTSGQGRRSQYFLVSLTSGCLARTAIYVTWDHSQQ